MASHRKTASQSILELVNPIPTSFDPEDDINTESRAKLVENYKEEFSEDDTLIPKFKKSLDLLEDQDIRYSGRKVSRKSLHIGTPEKHTSKKQQDASDEYESESEETSFTGDSEDNRDPIERGDGDVATTDCEEDESDGAFATNSVSGEDEEDVTDSSLGSNDARNNVTRYEDDNENFQHISDTNVNLEVEKGNCVRNQLRTWDSLLECRIHLQKCLLSANCMPYHNVFEDYKMKSGKLFKDELNKTQNFVTDLLEKFILLQEILLNSFHETKNISSAKRFSQSGSDILDEEIPSETEEEADSDEETEDGPKYEPKIKKRKLNEYASLLDSEHKKYLDYRNNTIQKWNDKTRVSSGKISSRDFSNFEQSTLKQIEQILSNRHRLIQRTQLKRSSYVILGHETAVDIHSKDSESEKLKEYDSEIFDDSDFYHQLLRELIERKAADVTDPVQLGRQWLELQKLRSKMKRKVDVRATKGRKIRYVVHPKLVNFMAPVVNNSWTEEAKSELYNSLFGKRKM